MKLAGYDFEGPFTDPSDVKELPGVYVVLSFGVLDVGESGWRYHEGGQGMSARLRTHDRKPLWELVARKGRGRASAYPEVLAACDGAFAKEILEKKCQEHSLSSRGDKKELCARLLRQGIETL